MKDADQFALPSRTLEITRYYDQTELDHDDNSVEVFEGMHVETKSWPEERTEIEWQGVPLQIEKTSAIGEYGDWSVFSETSPNIEVRLGAIYALERISQDSPRDHIRIMEILTAYIRGNVPVGSLEPSEPPFDRPKLRSDVQAALDVIGRREAELAALEHAQAYRLDLRNCDLSGANFSGGNFEAAMLAGSRLEAADFSSANLKGARLQRTLLNHVIFYEADLCGAMIDYSVLNGGGGWSAPFGFARDTRGMSMAGADISAVFFLSTKTTHTPTFGTADTKLAQPLQELRNQCKKDIQQYDYLIHGLEIEDKDDVIARLNETGFLGWSPYNADDGITGLNREKLWKTIGLNGFPFEDE